MSADAANELPEEFRLSLAEQIAQRPERTQPQASPEEAPLPPEPAGTGWLLAGMLIVVAVGVLMLLIFASGGNAEQSMML